LLRPARRSAYLPGVQPDRSDDRPPHDSWFETRQRVRAKRGPMINSDALLTMRIRDLILRV
jgi:hypothetical protein